MVRHGVILVPAPILARIHVQVELVRSGEHPIAQISESSGSRVVPTNRTCPDADEAKNTEPGRLRSDECAELAELRKRDRRLKVELEIVERAAGYFGKQNGRPA